MTPGSKRLLKGLLLVAAVAAVVGAVAIPLAYRARRTRWAAELGQAAQERLADGDTAEATRLYGLYLKESPNDAAGHAAYATLMRNQADLPGTGRKQREAALNAISTAVRKNPSSLPLRRMLALTLLELGQFGTARQEIGILREQVAAASAEDLAAAGIDLDEITLLEARTCFGNDNMTDAAALAAGLTGFDPAGKAFDAARKPGRFVTEASLLLAMILAEKRDDPQAAERVLEKLRETAPEDSRAWLALARWHLGRGQPRQAAEEIARAEALAPDDADVLSMAFAMAMADGRLDEAAQLAGRIRDLFPERPDGGLFLADVAVRRGKPEDAVEPLREALERQPGSPAILLSLANVQLLTMRLDDAEKTIRGLVERSERTNPAVGMLEARLLVARQQWLAAVKKLDAVRPLVAESSGTKRQIDLLLAECHARLGQTDEQLAASQRVLSRDSGSRSARVTAAAALAATGRPEKALAEYEAIAKEIGPEELLRQPQLWQPLLRLRGVHQLRLPARDRDWSQVERLLDELDRAQAAPTVQLAVLRYDHLVVAGDSAAAAALLASAIEAHGDEPQLWERRVTATLRQEGLAAALKQWETMPAAVVDDPGLLVLRARLASRAPEEEANGILQGLESKAVALPAGESGRLLAAIAAIRLGRGDPAGAERVWQTILQANPDDLQTHFALFELACEQRDLAKATRAADEVGRLCGPNSANGRAAAAAKLLLEVAVGRSQSAAAGAGGPPQSRKLDAEDMARLDGAKNLLVEAEHERPGWPLLQRLFADLELLRGDVPAAIERLEKAVELSPENLRLIRALVGLLAGSNRQPQARAVLRQIITATGDNVASDASQIWARRTLAELAARDGNFRDVEEAVAGLARNQDRDGKPAVEDMVLSIGVLSGRPEPEAWRRSLALLTALAERRPLTTPERMQRAELLDRTGRWEECREEMVALAALPEPPPAVLAAFVEKLIRHGELEQAAAQLKTLTAREPTAVGVITLEARLAVARGDQPAAVAAVQRLADAGKSSSKGPQQLLAVAVLMQELNLDEEADTLLGQLADQSVAGVLARVEFLARRGRTAEALDLLQANRQRLGAAAFLQAAVSVLRTADGDAEQAARVEGWFAAAPRIDRDGAGLSLLQAELLAVQGRHEEAAALYKEQLSRGNLPPTQRVILQNNLAMQLVRPETAAEAKRLIGEAIAEQGPHPSLLDTQGLALLAGGAPGEAVAVLREASLDRSVEKCLHLARALVADHELDDARQVLLEAQKRGLDRRHLDADDRKRLGEVEAALGIAGPKS
jgi:cellulose synthase operon protein C